MPFKLHVFLSCQTNKKALPAPSHVNVMFLLRLNFTFYFPFFLISLLPQCLQFNSFPFTIWDRTYGERVRHCHLRMYMEIKLIHTVVMFMWQWPLIFCWPKAGSSTSAVTMPFLSWRFLYACASGHLAWSDATGVVFMQPRRRNAIWLLVLA